MTVRIALVGNPNSGKTTLFNTLTGSSQYVGNWPGVTVEKKEGRLRQNKEVVITDLPGIYSLAPYTLEEVVSRNYILDERPDAIINLVDASNIERNLYLTSQVLELGVPVVVALNMIDVVRRRGDRVDVAKLAERLGCPVVETSALMGLGTREVAEKAVALAAGRRPAERHPEFGADLEAGLAEVEAALGDTVPAPLRRWYAVKLLERDKNVLERSTFPDAILARADAVRERLEKAHDDDMESVVTNERYLGIKRTLEGVLDKRHVGETVSDKIDSIVTNRFLALPIFAAVMFLVYYLSISTIGTMGTDWINDTLFGENGIPSAASGLLQSLGVPPLPESLIVDGIIGGVGAVLGFLPQIVMLYLCLAALEDLGYMARIAFIMDRLFRRFGLSGKSFIPMLIGTGCSVPGIMGTRTIEDDKDRRMTIILTSFMPCSAKIPIIALVANALFGGAWWLAPVAYFTCILGIIVSGIILKKTLLFAGDPAPFIMELPAYHVPSGRNVVLHTWERAKAFAYKAGTVILMATVILWVLMRFTPSFELIDFAEAGSKSILAVIGTAIAPLFRPLGFGSWEATVATFSGLIAKEQLVATFGIMTHLGDVDPEAVAENAALLTTTAKMFSTVGGFSFLLFNLFCTPCVAAMGAIVREMNSLKWSLVAFGYQTVFAYAVSLVVFQLGSVAVAGAPFTPWTGVAAALLLWGLWLMFRSYGKDKGGFLIYARRRSA